MAHYTLITSLCVQAYIRGGLHLSVFYGSASVLLPTAYAALATQKSAGLRGAVELLTELVGDAAVELSATLGVLLPASLADPTALPAESFATISGIVATIEAFNNASTRILAAIDSGDSDVRSVALTGIWNVVGVEFLLYRTVLLF